MNRRTLFLGVLLTTLATLTLELTLTRLFSATMYYHFAFMAISLALFGSGASGVFIYVFRRRVDRAPAAERLALTSLCFAIGALIALYVILHNPLTLDQSSHNYYRLALVYVATALPFFFSGCTVTLAITSHSHEINRLYLFDLIGATGGCLLLIPLLNIAGAINTVLVVAVLAAAAGLVFSLRTSRSYATVSIVVLAGMLSLLVYNGQTHRIDIHQAKGKEETDVLFSKWNSFSRITVVGDLNSRGPEIQIDADAATGIVKNGPAARTAGQPSGSISALAYRLKQNADALVIGPGGGSDVRNAMAGRMRHITAVEVNPIIARDVMSSHPFSDYSGYIYQQPDVTLAVDEGRSFIRSSSKRYDIIQATMVDTWAATAAGAFALTENNLYTVEAFKDYANHLTPDGILTMTRWYFEPPDQLLRLITITRAMMDDLGIPDAPDHIIIVRDSSADYQRTPATYLFKKSPFTPGEVKLIEDASAQLGFQVLYSPANRPANLFTKMIEAPDPSTVWKTLPGNVEPTYDNNPFFFNSLRISRLASGLGGTYEWHKTNLGTLILFGLLVITSVLVVLFIIGPLAIARGNTFASGGGFKLAYLLYFACLGFGFIIVEVAMIQKFILFLGHPVYSLTVVLFSLLTFSGIGSYLGGRLSEDKLASSIARIILGLSALIVVYIAGLSPVFYGLVQLALPARIAIAVVLMAPLALLMGMPMPTGIRILRKHLPQIIPWAWGINGAASVSGSVVALVIALLTGFNQALIAGAALYVLAAFIISRANASVPKQAPIEVAAAGTAKA